jgi:hypothetical protein
MRSIPRPLIGLYAAAQLPLDYSIKFYRQLQDNIRVNRNRSFTPARDITLRWLGGAAA